MIQIHATRKLFEKLPLNEEFPTTDSRLLSLKDMGVIKSWEDWEVWRIE